MPPPPVQPEWYQQGFWPLIGAAIILIIPNAVALWGIFIQTRRQTKSQLLFNQINFISQQLADFYDPLYALLTINNDCFTKLGPNTFPKDPLLADTAGEIWNQIKQKTIIPNNRKIAEIFRTQSHLLSNNDSIEAYKQLIGHIAMYEVFVDMPNEVYKDFTFPKDVTNHLIIARMDLVKELNTIKKGVK
jgi:hypothetical protein